MTREPGPCGNGNQAWHGDREPCLRRCGFKVRDLKMPQVFGHTGAEEQVEFSSMRITEYLS